MVSATVVTIVPAAPPAIQGVPIVQVPRNKIYGITGIKIANIPAGAEVIRIVDTCEDVDGNAQERDVLVVNLAVNELMYSDTMLGDGCELFGDVIVATDGPTADIEVTLVWEDKTKAFDFTRTSMN